MVEIYKYLTWLLINLTKFKPLKMSFFVSKKDFRIFHAVKNEITVFFVRVQSNDLIEPFKSENDCLARHLARHLLTKVIK